MPIIIDELVVPPRSPAGQATRSETSTPVEPEPTEAILRRIIEQEALRAARTRAC